MGKFIEYSNDDKPGFIVELRERVTEYFSEKDISSYGNRRLVFKTIFFLTLYIAPFIIMLSGTINSLIYFFLLYILMGIGKAGVGMNIMHDANHGSYSENDTVNKWIGKSIYLLGGIPNTWKYQHNTMHHGFTNVDGFDEDIDPGKTIRLSPHKPLYKYHRFQHIYAWILYGLMTILWISTKDFKQLIAYKKENVPLSNKYSYRMLYVDLIISKILYYSVLLVVPLLIFPFAWYWVLLAFFIMHYTAGLILSTVFQTAHVVTTSEYPLPDDEGKMGNGWAVHQLKTTSDFAPSSKLLSWLTGGLNCQVEHHLLPNICHVHYVALAPIVRETALKYNLPYHAEKSFIAALKNHIAMLKLLGRGEARMV